MFAELNEALTNASSSDNATQTILDAFDSVTSNATFAENFGEYVTVQGMQDLEAFMELMGAVDHFAGELVTKENIADSNLYQSESIASTINNYIGAVKIAGGMENPPTLAPGQILVYVDASGNVVCLPFEIYPATR